MIKFKINGIEVEVDNIADAKALMSIEQPKEVVPRKSSKKELYSRWTIEEAQKLTDAIDNDTEKKVVKDAGLRDKHTRGAISGMIWRLRKPERIAKYPLTTEVQAYVQNWSSKRNA